MSKANMTWETQLVIRAGIIPVCLMRKSLLWLLKTLEQAQGHGTSYVPLAF